MNKREWIHIDAFQRQNKIGVMHNPKDGNFLVYYNDKVILVDFKVFESKKFKFFLDEEFCEISVIRKKKGFSYEFAFDTKTKTKKNILRKKDILQQNRKGLKWLIGVPLVIIIAIWSYTLLRSQYLESSLEKYPVSTWATYKVFKKTGSDVYQSFYYFTEEKTGENIQSKIVYSKSPPTTSQGLPLKNKDQFRLIYSSKHNFHHQLDFNQPSQKTVEDIIERILPFHLKNQQGRMTSEIKCEIQVAYQLKQLDGLADIYYQQTPSSENSKHNSDSYLRLIRDTPFQKEMEKCLTGGF